MGWLLPDFELTPDQQRMVRLSPDQNRLITGPPGSGKSQILVHRARFLMDRFQIGPQSFRVFLFTRVLRDYIQSGLDDVGLPPQSVTTFDGFCSQFHKDHISKKLPTAGKSGTDFAEVRSRVLDFVEQNSKFHNLYRFILVDEGQDLTEEAHAILYYLGEHVTVFADEQQKVFEEGADLQSVRQIYSIQGEGHSLLGAFRNSPEVAQLASYFIKDQTSRQKYLNMTSTGVKVRELPLYFVAADHEQEMQRLAGVIMQRQALNERVVVILPQNRLVHGYAQGLIERGVQVERALPVGGDADFHGELPKLCTYHSVKGLTFDSALLPRLQSSYVRKFESGLLETMLFTGMTRATHWVYLSSTRPDGFGNFSVFERAAANNHLALQRSGAAEGPCGDDSAEDNEDEDFLL